MIQTTNHFSGRRVIFFQYLFGVKEGDCYGAIALDPPKSILFIPKLPPDYATWMGKIKSPSHFREVYKVDECHFVDDIESVLTSLGCKVIYIIQGKNTDSGNTHHGANFPGIEKFEVDKTALFPIIAECRVVKTDKEIEVMRYICRVSAEAHKEVIKSIKPGDLEYQMESLFRHYIYSNYGARNLAYTCICGSGLNSSILHYGHAGAPNSKIIKDGDTVMFDMGGEYHCYCADISRSFPANGKFSPVQREIYLSVFEAHRAVLRAVRAGINWADMHRLAYEVICAKLKEYSFLKGDVQEMIDNDIPFLFMPHGLGHFLGLETHDVGGYPQGTERIKKPGFSRLRANRILQTNMIITVEPGIYFIRHLLEAAMQNPNLNRFLNIDKIRENIDFGGVRIEDDIVILDNGCENLSSACPSTIEEIEQLMDKVHPK